MGGRAGQAYQTQLCHQVTSTWLMRIACKLASLKLNIALSLQFKYPACSSVSFDLLKDPKVFKQWSVADVITVVDTLTTLCLIALHIAQSGTDSLPFSGDKILPCLASLHYVTSGSLPSFCIMNVQKIHKTQVFVGSARECMRGATALVASLHLQQSLPLC